MQSAAITPRNESRLSRRSILTLGALAPLGFSLADLFRAEAQAGITSSRKSVINIHLDGGPPQMDTIDLKPDAPAEIRGEFQAIETKLPGFRVCELLPKIASIADKLVFLRSLVGADGQHNAYQCQSGFTAKDLAAQGGWPAMGCVLTKLWSTPNDPAPTFVDMMQGRPLVRDSARPGFLGPAFKPFRPDMSQQFQRSLEEGMKGELQRRGPNHTTKLDLNEQLDADRLEQRSKLRGGLDRFASHEDPKGMMTALDRFHEQAASILTSGKFAEALDLSKEDPRILASYTPDVSLVRGRHVTSDQPHATQKLLLARKAIEAGVRCVSVSLSDYDTHSGNYPRLRQLLPMLDHGLHALVTDLEQRGMLDDVSIIVWGEFGRTPKVNSKGGRDHWPKVSPGIMAGGGINAGQVIGSTDRIASEVQDRPVHYKDVFASLYRNLGIDPHRTTVIDPTGRPQYLLDFGTPIAELY